MPTVLPSSSVAEIRAALLPEVQGALYSGTTTSAGSAGGTTGVDSALGVFENDRFLNWWLLRDATREYRRISASAESTGTLTWLVAMGTQFGNGAAYQLFKFDPSLVTRAIQAAIVTSYNDRAVFRPANGFIVPNQPGVGERNVYALPSSIDRVWGVRRLAGSQKFYDDFATYAGWTNVSGTGSVSSGVFVFTAVADTNLVVRTTDPNLRDGYVSLDVAGDTDAAYDVLCPVFRYIDSSNYLWVRLVTDASANEEVQLMRRSDGSDTEVASALVSLTEAVRNRIEVYYVGRRVQVWVDGKQYLDHLLSINDIKYLNGTNVGIRESTTGSPSVTAAADDFRCHAVQGEWLDVRDWKQDGDLLVYGSRGTAPGLGSDGLLYVMGAAPLTQPGSDTSGAVGAGTLNAADATDVLEIASSDPAYRTFLRYVEHHLYLMLSRPGVIDDADEAAGWERAAAQALAIARRMQGMPRPALRLRTPSL